MKLLMFAAAAMLIFAGCTGNSGGNTQTNTTLRAIGASELAQHNAASDCWIAINGKVLDLSGFSSVHPGDGAYLPYCGKDGTQGFATKGGTGGPHTQAAQSMMGKYVIGTFVN
jgi:cytochrome b involved in lipid metabolism